MQIPGKPLDEGRLSDARLTDSEEGKAIGSAEKTSIEETTTDDGGSRR